MSPPNLGILEPVGGPYRQSLPDAAEWHEFVFKYMELRSSVFADIKSGDGQSQLWDLLIVSERRGKWTLVLSQNSAEWSKSSNFCSALRESNSFGTSSQLSPCQDGNRLSQKRAPPIKI
jgi:hypothetical protein